MMRFGFVVCSVLVSIAFATDIPDFLKVCSRNDPNLDDCFKKSVEHLQPYLETGVPEYHLPTLEPLLLKELVVSEGQGLKLTCNDLKVTGAGNYIVKKVHVDMQKLRFSCDIGLPHIFVDGIYKTDGRLLLLMVSGSGPVRGNFTDCLGEVVFNAEVNGDRFHIKDLDIKLTVGGGGLQVENLFNGEKVLGDVVNSAINSNFDAFVRELLPLIADSLSTIFLEIGNNIVGHFTFDQLFPE